MKRKPFLVAFLAALGLHVLALSLLSLGWEAWQRLAPVPDSPDLIAVTPLLTLPEPEPVLPPELIADTAPQSMPATPTLSAPVAPPIPPVTPAPPPPKPVRSAPVTRISPPQAAPVRRRQTEPAPPAAVVREAPPATVPAQPLGRAGSGSPAPSPVADAPPGPGAGQDVGALAGPGGLPVPAGAEGSGRGATGAGGEGQGPGAGSASAGTGSGRGGGVGAGRGASGGTGALTSVRPLGGYQVKPRYPESARRQGAEGTALLKMRITEQGRVEDVQVERSAGHAALDQAALDAVRHWRFEPSRRNGAAEAVWVVLPVEFKLQ